MVRRLTRPLVVLAAVIVALLATVTPAHASTTYGYGVGADGFTEGGIIWYNRTVEIQGYIRDAADCSYSNCATTVYFLFYQGTVHLDLDETRSDLAIWPPSYKDVDYHFSVTGPRGGITRVHIRVVTLNGIAYGDCTSSGCTP